MRRYSRLLETLKIHEGFKSYLYKCSSGKWTIGFGRNIQDKGLSQKECEALFGINVPFAGQVEFLKDKTVTKEQAEFLLKNDMFDAEKLIMKYYPEIYKRLNDARKNVLVNMVFNMGIGKDGLGGFVGFLKALCEGNYSLAAHEMLDSKWARKQVGQRATYLAEIMLTGEDNE